MMNDTPNVPTESISELHASPVGKNSLPMVMAK